MVKKSKGGWRMCVDCIDINKACPKDCYPLPEIDWKVESLSGFWLKCFLDAYKGYHQIQMAEGDEDKTPFFAGEGAFCYRKMPFGLKNYGATHLRLVDMVFHDQIGRNLEAYIDDMLNPKKCSFGVEEGPFIGYLITKQGIWANPSKVKAITDVGQLKTLKDVHSLNGKIAALSRFLSKSAERSFPFFKVLKSCTYKKNIQWTQEAEATLQEMKKFMEILPTLTTLIQEEILIIYLTSSTESISTALFAKREEDQVPIYTSIDNKKETKEKANTKPAKTRCEWKLFTDGAVSSDGSGAGLMLIDLEGKEYTYTLRFRFETTNNELLVNKIKGTYVAKQPTIREYLQKTKEALKGFDSYTIEHIRRNQNKKADALSKLTWMTFEHLTKEVLVEVLSKQSIEDKEILQVKTKEGESWMTPIHMYLVSGLLPEDPKESRMIKVKAPQCKLIRGNLYRRSFYTLWFRCVASPQTDDIRFQILDNSRRTLQEMGRSKTRDRYKQNACRKIRMGIRSVQIRSAINNQLEGPEAFPRRNNEPHRKAIGSKSTRMGGRSRSNSMDT
ncbi:reverse transcriptase domain-containing protein [Tanacetum coccineum]